jgi:transcription termination factor Rho
MDENSLNRMYILRKVLSPLSPVDSMEFLMGKIEKTESNAEFLESMNS